MTQFLRSPSGRLSIRRALFALSVLTSCGCAVASMVLKFDIGPGAVSVLASTTAATAAATGLGRFTEKGTEPNGAA
jgi:hypothetical protein